MPNSCDSLRSRSRPPSSALTPIGLDVYRVQVTTGGRTEYFWEWGPPDFTSPNAALLALTVWTGLRSEPVE